jgi:hypothetical protein
VVSFFSIRQPRIRTWIGVSSITTALLVDDIPFYCDLNRQFQLILNPAIQGMNDPASRLLIYLQQIVWMPGINLFISIFWKFSH